MNIIAGLAIIGIGIFAIAIVIKVLKENEVVEAARAEDLHKAMQLEIKRLDWIDTSQNPLLPTPQNMNLWSHGWTPELNAFIRNHGISLESSNEYTRDIYRRSTGYINMTDPNFGLFEHPSVDGDRLGEYMVDSFECTGTAEDAEKIGLKLD